MASWNRHTRSGLESVRCPAHGNLAVRRVTGAWVMKCETCLHDAVRAAGRLRLWLK